MIDSIIIVLDVKFYIKLLLLVENWQQISIAKYFGALSNTLTHSAKEMDTFSGYLGIPFCAQE